jgi:hypothetical protein
MKLIFQIVFLLFAWLTNLNATPVFAKIVFPSYELAFSKIENTKKESDVKIGVLNFARSSIEDDFSSILKGAVWTSVSFWGEGEVIIQQAGRHPNWVEVLDIRTKILAKKSHVLEVEGLNKTRNYNGTTMEGFTGCHSDQALSDYVATNGGTYRINGKPTNLQPDEVFEGQPIITLNGKEYVKTNGPPIVEYSTGKYGGTSTFFPENWNNTKILDEVEYAIANNHGVAPGNNPSEYFGFSRDGKVEIHFYLNNDGTIGSYFPKKR